MKPASTTLLGYTQSGSPLVRHCDFIDRRTSTRSAEPTTPTAKPSAKPTAQAAPKPSAQPASLRERFLAAGWTERDFQQLQKVGELAVAAGWAKPQARADAGAPGAALLGLELTRQEGDALLALASLPAVQAMLLEKRVVDQEEAELAVEAELQAKGSSGSNERDEPESFETKAHRATGESWKKPERS
jgi:hypothetical protein